MGHCGHLGCWAHGQVCAESPGCWRPSVAPAPSTSLPELRATGMSNRQSPAESPPSAFCQPSGPPGLLPCRSHWAWGTTTAAPRPCPVPPSARRPCVKASLSAYKAVGHAAALLTAATMLLSITRPTCTPGRHNCPSRLQIAAPGRPICINPPAPPNAIGARVRTRHQS